MFDHALHFPAPPNQRSRPSRSSQTCGADFFNFVRILWRAWSVFLHPCPADSLTHYFEGNKKKGANLIGLALILIF
jgi:hypothetical protein